MKKLSLILSKISLVCLLVLCSVVSAYADGINGLRISQSRDGARVVLDSADEFDYNVFLLDNPKRLVIDVDNVDVSSKIEKGQTSNNFLGGVRVGKIDNSKSRIVFDLRRPVIIKKDLMLPPQSTFKWRLAIDVVSASNSDFVAQTGQKHSVGRQKKSGKVAQSTSNNNNSAKIIVIDAGHGGHDPGAIGYSGVYEKNITLAAAKELKRLLDKEGKYKVFLTRSTDIFIPLRQRVQIARKHNASLFVSIHADSAVNRNAKGLSVYTLSETASDKEAAALAERENKADVITGLNMVEQSKEVSDVLISLAQRETRNRSSELARCVEVEMRKSVQLISDTHRFAGFAVLKAPDVPSILLEMGYLSNKNEERLLRQDSYRHKIASSMVKAINRYFEDMKYKSLF